jgi:hypothetical protein
VRIRLNTDRDVVFIHRNLRDVKRVLGCTTVSKLPTLRRNTSKDGTNAERDE